jgi:RimJ/RimL family protein N-acetyltransferase
VTTSATRIVTARLLLDVPVAADLPGLMQIVSHPETTRHLGGVQSAPEQFTRLLRNAGSWPLYGYGGFAVRLRESGALVGQVGVFHAWRGLGPDADNLPEAGWILGHGHTGRGLAREAAAAVLDWFDAAHGPQPIVALIDPDNAPSLALAARLGFVPVRDTELGGAPVRLLRRS